MTEEDKRTIVPNNRTIVFVAAFTTCWARLKLYSYLETLQHQVLYYDTDSVIYKWKEGLPRIETGDFLGEMKNEVEGDHIVEFVSGAPKKTRRIPEVLGAHVSVKGDSHVLIVKKDGMTPRSPEQPGALCPEEGEAADSRCSSFNKGKSSTASGRRHSDMGVVIVKALEETTRQHLTNIGVKEEDKVILAITTQGFEHTY